MMNELKFAYAMKDAPDMGVWPIQEKVYKRLIKGPRSHFDYNEAIS